MNDIVMVNDANVESVIAADKPVILAIGASWCPDCRRAQPFFTQLAAVNAERAVFASCDSEQNPQVVAKYAVQHLPTMVALKGGREVDRIVELKTPGELKAFVERNICRPHKSFSGSPDPRYLLEAPAGQDVCGCLFV